MNQTAKMKRSFINMEMLYQFRYYLGSTCKVATAYRWICNKYEVD